MSRNTNIKSLCLLTRGLALGWKPKINPEKFLDEKLSTRGSLNKFLVFFAKMLLRKSALAIENEDKIDSLNEATNEINAPTQPISHLKEEKLVEIAAPIPTSPSSPTDSTCRSSFLLRRRPAQN